MHIDPSAGFTAAVLMRLTRLTRGSARHARSRRLRVAEDDAAQRPPEPPRAPAHPAGRDPVVLVVDDEASVRGVLARALSRSGYRVLVAENGAAAVELLEEPGLARPDLVISDVLMPAMDGTALAEWVGVRHPGLPVLLMTGYIPDLELLESLANVPGSVIRKPFDLLDLLARVRAAVLASPSMARSAA